MPSNKSLPATAAGPLCSEGMRCICAQASPSRLSLSFHGRPLDTDGYLLTVTWNMVAVWSHSSRWTRLGLAATWAVMASGLACLFVIHPMLDGTLVVPAGALIVTSSAWPGRAFMSSTKYSA
jgi:hypothetical protein